jgi:hypothetical protein
MISLGDFPRGNLLRLYGQKEIAINFAGRTRPAKNVQDGVCHGAR